MLHQSQQVYLLKVVHQLHINHVIIFYDKSGILIRMKQKPFEQYFKLREQGLFLSYLMTPYIYIDLGYEEDHYGKVYLGSGRWAKFNLYWDFVERWEVEELDLNHNEVKIYQLIKIKFPCLQKLYLSSNNIESIQALYQLQAPHLQYLNLSSNHITSIKTLSKICQGKPLKLLNISLNNINEINILSQLNFDTITQILDIEACDRQAQSDVRIIFKCEFISLKCIRTNTYIFDEWFVKMMKKSKLFY